MRQNVIREDPAAVYGGHGQGKGTEGRKPITSHVPERKEGVNPSAPNEISVTPRSTEEKAS